MREAKEQIARGEVLSADEIRREIASGLSIHPAMAAGGTSQISEENIKPLIKPSTGE